MTCRVTTGNVPTQTAVVAAQPRRDAYFANASLSRRMRGRGALQKTTLYRILGAEKAS